MPATRKFPVYFSLFSRFLMPFSAVETKLVDKNECIEEFRQNLVSRRWKMKRTLRNGWAKSPAKTNRNLFFVESHFPTIWPHQFAHHFQCKVIFKSVSVVSINHITSICSQFQLLSCRRHNLTHDMNINSFWCLLTIDGGSTPTDFQIKNKRCLENTHQIHLKSTRLINRFCVKNNKWNFHRLTREVNHTCTNSLARLSSVNLVCV